MFSRNLLILYVKNPASSARFYGRLFEKEPVESSENFAMFALDGGLMLGLWAQTDVQPASSTPAGATELALTVADKATVDSLHQQWHANGVVVSQPPTSMDFGYTFTAQDSDGHRIRVFAAH